MKLEDFPIRAFDKLRYGDTDRQGHVNNSRFLTFFETGRTELLHAEGDKKADEGCSFVLAKVTVEFRAELLWPGTIHIGTKITKLGNSSITFHQALFQNDALAAVCESVIVQTNDQTRKSQPLSDAARQRFEALIIATSA